ncbi:SAM-dependent methyltransferase [Pseudohaliea rubra]|uniref:Cyclopropane-fatty-acyl-phospholipid synthase, plant type n=1 Tax=Pseudohaliea rubra DSM 19751 TaxID=1265313 RepID=A0A095VPX4_9GAMM|nr:cyclopropane-fatty-acyl-phospholipid synthase family protein [Pseudohaliea rubra]KGE03143.1 Cyclopropane-fatty-acyl-phospholipid synthase, plant type [Pseudohaliea rubra DSM 19751]
MNDLSVSRIRLLPQARSLLGGDLARKLMLGVLGKISTGSLVLRDGEETLNFGERGHPDEPQAEIVVHNREAYRKVLTGGTIASGEAYIEGDWSSPDPTEVTRLFSANMAALETMQAKQHWYVRAGLAVAHAMNRNTHEGSRRNIAAHYDLGNDFFGLFLDPTMMYSAAIFDDPAATLETAAVAKLDAICQQLELKPTDHLVEIGTGWGGMAIHAAGRYGCRVTTTTISREQYEHARAAVARHGLQDRITVLCEDYRQLTGRYDKLVSIEMIEAVGHDFYQSYFQCCSKLLKADGKMVIQAITIPDQRYDRARRSVDYIKRYIFPGGCLPSLGVIARHIAEDTDMQLVNLRDITRDYARTLAHWRDRFLANLDSVRDQGFDDRFIRMWEFYLCYCEGGFRERIIGTAQLTFAKPGYRPPGG